MKKRLFVLIGIMLLILILSYCNRLSGFGLRPVNSGGGPVMNNGSNNP